MTAGTLKNMGRKAMTATLASFFMAGAAAAAPASHSIDAVQESARAFAQHLIEDAPKSGSYCGLVYMSVCVPSFCSIFADQPEQAEACVQAASEHLAAALPSQDQPQAATAAVAR